MQLKWLLKNFTVLKFTKKCPFFIISSVKWESSLLLSEIEMQYELLEICTANICEELKVGMKVDQKLYF